MAKEELLQFEGEVIDVLPNAMFRIKLDESGHKILGHISGRMRTNNINVLLHDRVTVEVSQYDLTKGRIVFRKK